MSLTDAQIRKKLMGYGQNDIYFLKSEWRAWIANKDFSKFQTIANKPNVLLVYKILEPSSIIYAKPARLDFYEVRVKHSPNFDIAVILKFNEEKDRIDIMTYYQESTKGRA